MSQKADTGQMEERAKGEVDMESQIVSQKSGYILREAREEDVEKYYERNYCPLDPEVARFTGCKKEFTKEEVTSFFRKSLEEENRCLFLVISSDGQIIGESVISEIDWRLRCASFRIAIFRQEERNRGLGRWMVEETRDFAFDKLHLHRLELEVYSFNKRAEKVYAKAGFRREGILRDAVLDGDTYGDTILMAILEDEWKEIKEKA